MRTPFRLVLAGSLVVLLAAIMPAALGAASPSRDAAIPDQWSGEWPAQLMEKTGNTPLGTLTWRPIRYEDGMALVGKNFGGQPFTGCPADGNTRFFRGRYVQGGNLIGCTRGADGTELVGRFDGNESFQSSDFDIRITGTNPSFFVGTYDEDGGLEVDWCGLRSRILTIAELPDGTVDYTAPAVRMRAVAARVGGIAKLRFSVRDASATVRVDLVVVAGQKAIANLSLPAVKANGATTTKTWRVPAKARGKKLRVCAAALDRAGNISARSCAKLTVT